MCPIIALPLEGQHVCLKDWEKGLNRQIMGPLILQREGCHLGAAVVYILRKGWRSKNGRELWKVLWKKM